MESHLSGQIKSSTFNSDLDCLLCHNFYLHGFNIKYVAINLLGIFIRYELFRHMHISILRRHKHLQPIMEMSWFIIIIRCSCQGEKFIYVCIYLHKYIYLFWKYITNHVLENTLIWFTMGPVDSNLFLKWISVWRIAAMSSMALLVENSSTVRATNRRRASIKH